MQIGRMEKSSAKFGGATQRISSTFTVASTLAITMSEFEVGCDEDSNPPCPACNEETTASQVVDIGKYTYIGKIWDCRNEECDLDYVPNE